MSQTAASNPAALALGLLGLILASKVEIPLTGNPIPITLQTLALHLLGFYLESGSITVTITFLALAFAGVPVSLSAHLGLRQRSLLALQRQLRMSNLRRALSNRRALIHCQTFCGQVGAKTARRSRGYVLGFVVTQALAALLFGNGVGRGSDLLGRALVFALADAVILALGAAWLYKVTPFAHMSVDAFSLDVKSRHLAAWLRFDGAAKQIAPP